MLRALAADLPFWRYVEIAGLSGRALFAALARLAIGAATLATLATWIAASRDLAAAQPPAATLEQIVIAAAPPRAPTAVATLGRSQLLQNAVGGAAAEQHVRFFRHGDGRWEIGAASLNRQLLLRYADGARLLAARVLLTGGARLSLATPAGPATAAVERRGADAVSVVVESAGPLARYSVRLAHGEAVAVCRDAPAPHCIEAPAIRGVAAALRTAVGRQGERVVARLGGTSLALIDGAAILPVAGYPFDGARIVNAPGRGPALAPGRDRFVEFTRGGEGRSMRFIDSLHPVNPKDGPQLSGFVAGRTEYAVQVRGGALELRPVSGRHRYRGETDAPLDARNPTSDLATSLTMFSADPRERDQIRRSQAPAPDLARLWSLPDAARPLLAPAPTGAALATFALLLVVTLARRGGGLRRPTRARVAAQFATHVLVAAAGATAAACATVASLPRPAATVPVDPLIAAIAMGAAGLCVLVVAGRLAGLLFALATTLIAAGSHDLLAMALSADELRWARFHDDMVHAIALGATAICVTLALPPDFFLALARALSRPGAGWRVIAWPLGLVVLTALGNGVAWFLLGSEAGILGVFQPSELIKTLYVAIVAAIGALFLRRRFGGRAAPGGRALVWPMLVAAAMLALILVTPVVSHDLSPFLILSLTLCCSLPVILLFDVVARWSHRLGAPIRRDRPPPGPPDERDNHGVFPARGPAQRLLSRLARFAPNARNGVEWFGFVAPPLLVFALATTIVVAAQSPRETIDLVERRTPDALWKPARRIVSWLELGLNADAAEGPAAGLPVIDHPDAGRQVMRSRAAIAAAPCRLSGASGATGHPLDPAQWGRAGLAAAARALAAIGAAPRDCVRPAEAGAHRHVAELDVPEIQNDFILAWAFNALGKDGALALLAAQIAFCLTLLTMAFAMLRSAAGAEEQRVAATFYGAATISMFFVIALQFAISWMNAFGLLPVMGQPMTYLSQGRSHFLTVGVAAILLPIVGARCLATPNFGIRQDLPTPPRRHRRRARVAFDRRTGRLGLSRRSARRAGAA